MLIENIALIGITIASSVINVPISNHDGPGGDFIYQMTLYCLPQGSSSSGSNNFGHAFVSFTNPYSFSLQMGYYSVPAYSTLFLGKWASTLCGSTFSPHAGVEYNFEPFLNRSLSLRPSDTIVRYFTVNFYGSRCSACSYFVQSESEGYDALRDNCVTFATGFYRNCQPDSTLFTNCIAPATLYTEIGNESSGQTMAASALPFSSSWFYYDASGNLHTEG
jgi:hypothetical protein